MRLIRWPNLLFIALTQCLFQYAVVRAIGLTHNHALPPYPSGSFICLLAASLLIAAGGYIINDYFDLNIDQVNKPAKVVITRVISRREAIVWHWLLSGTGVLLSGIVSYRIHAFWLLPANFIATVLLWFYSARFKKTNLTGNVITSLLTAWVIVVLLPLNWTSQPAFNAQLLRLAGLYAGFAFILSIIREVIKDMEDVEGDRRYGCNTMPIAWGINAAKVFTAVWLIVLIVVLLVVQIYLYLILQSVYFKWLGIIYAVSFVIIPLIYILKSLFTAHAAPDFHRLSTQVKRVMLAGILSMAFFLIYE